MVRQRVRIRFRKQGDLRLIGHRDLVRLMERLFRRGGLRLGMSQGFHPKPRMSFPSALAVGIAGCDEVMELELAQTRTAEQLRRQLEPHAPPGLTLKSIEILPSGTKKARVRSLTYRMPVPPPRHREAAQRVAELLARRCHRIGRPNRRTTIDLRQCLESLTLADGVLQMRLRPYPHGTPSPREVLTVLEMADLQREGFPLTRTGVELQP